MVIPINKIRENPVALRKVNKTSEAYGGLVDSIRREGVMNPIVVREIKDPGSGDMIYGLVDGLHRFSGAQDAGLKEVPCNVKSMSDSAVLEAQIIANIHKVETRPVEYSKQLVKILAQNPFMTEAELSSKLSKSPSWLRERLGLASLAENIASIVDEGKINLSNAYALAKLAKEEPEEVVNYLDKAMTSTPQEFVPLITSRIKEIKDARRKGTDAKPDSFIATPRLRKLPELKNELTNPTVGPLMIRDMKVSDPATAFNLGLQWALCMDPQSISQRTQRDADRKKELENEKQKRAAEREQKKAEESKSVLALA